jgi:hypothetical protein
MRVVRICKPAAPLVREIARRVNRADIDAITIADTVFLMEPAPVGDDLARLMRHERVHVEQNARQAPWWARWMPLSWRARLGAPKQSVLYVAEWMEKGYWNNKYEEEARAAE